MKFQSDTLEGVNVITRQEPGRLWISARVNTGVDVLPFDHSLLVPWVGPVLPWDVASFEALTAAHFERIVALQPEVVIFGSGHRLRFPAPALLRALIDRGIGVEAMDTAAASRTYNVLVNEKRSVLGAFLLEREV